ncbi:maternal protein tudor-like isoform X3 [Hyposmocoma kahamanoa]|nr:maternal protein tudor-like isoform X3 [Hyposmocoma kahamanoa]
MLALEKTLMANIVGVLSNDTMLVSLVDDTVNPPLDVARRMTQLSQPRSNIEPKATTPVRKEAPESFSSPEGSEDSRKKSFRREKSFKDDRRPPRDGADDFGQRGSSFRSRENKEPFERSGPGRHSDKFAGRPDPRSDRGERRGGPKPRENPPGAPAVAACDDEWEESTVSQPPPRSNFRDNRDNNRDNNRRKPREHQGTRPNWKGKDSSGVGKRLKQAAEAASLDTQNIHKGYSIQDRLKRDNKSNQPSDGEYKRNDEWGNRSGRPDRRDNRGDRRDNWGDKENFQKREFRDNNRERGDRTKSNFTPRERAERSFGSDSDKKSETNFRSQEGGGSAGRAPPYKSRSKFTQVQYKELSDPVPLESEFQEPTIENGAQHEVSVTWIISPESFYTQILSLQQKFVDMMHIIPELYKGVKSYTGIVPVGASVLARYPADGVLYRATVVSVQPFSKFIVRYVDFGNKQLVDAKDIWQLDRQLMDLPKMAVHCSLLGVAPKDGEWKASPDVDLCFNAPRYQCVFQEYVESHWKVSLWNNGVNVADTLIEKQLAVMSEHQSSVALKDEAIDLTIIVGQQILCKVTHVESYEKFYVQLDLDKAELVEKAIASFDTSKLTPLAPESLMEGVHCTVKHEDKIYRAILEDVSDTQNVRAVLPDYGFTITTPVANLMILPTELSVYYYQSLECSLNNYTAESNTLMTLEKMKQCLLNNKFIIYINYVEGISLMSTLYDVATGKKIAIFEPDEGAYDEVVPLCTRAVFNYNFGMAYISHSEDLNEIYLQKSTDSDRLAQLLESLFQFYEEGTPEAMSTFEVDALCAAKSSDGNWYRATILSVEESEVKVQFSDYGNSESVAKDSVKQLDLTFYETCSLALVAGLGLVALQDNTLTKLMEWTTDKEVQVTLALGSDGWLASLHLDGVDLAMKLVNEKLATPQVGSNEDQKVEASVEEPLSLPPGSTQVYISHIDTPGHFWLQMADKVDTIEEIQAELQANAGNYPDIENRDMGTLCIAKYLADDQWYRAVILDSDSDITTVRFTDYGNTDVLDNQPGLIKTIPNHLKEIESYALKSSVNAVPTGTGEWSESASEYFTQLVGDLSLPVDALIVLKDVTTYVDIFVNGQNITDKLVSEGHATKTEETECGDLPSCFASHINSPSEFWIQLESAAPELQAMESAMVDAENFPELTEKEEGVICAAKYPEDGAWYRAQVIVDGSEGTEVLFMDYGNASIANELRSLPSELKMKPALSRKCALQKPRDVKSWSRKSEIKFNELAAEGATIFNVQFIASGDISIVELHLDGKSVTEELVCLCEDHPSTERPTPVGQDLLSSGKICYVNSVDEFYVQLDDNVADVDKIIDRLSGAADFESAMELKVGSLCAAFWEDDEQWYRSKILEFCDVGYHVLFIDYGNKAKAQEFRQLPEDLIAIEPAAKCCRFAGLEDNTVKESAKAKLDDLAADSSSTFQIEFLDSTKEPALVKLYLNGKDVVSIITSDETSEQVANESGEPISDSTVQQLITEQVEKLITEQVTKTDVDSTPPTEPETIEANVEVEKSSDITEAPISVDTNSATEEACNLVSGDHEPKSSVLETSIEKAEVTATPSEKDTENEEPDHYESANEELNTSQPELNESVESSNTVIENKSFDSKADNSSDDILEDAKDETPISPDKNLSSETLENSHDTIKTPDRDDSKDSFNTDTGYTSDHDKMSPMKDEDSTVKDLETPKKELVSDQTVTEKVEEEIAVRVNSPEKDVNKSAIESVKE